MEEEEYYYYDVATAAAQNRLLFKGGCVVNYDMMKDAFVYIEDGIIMSVKEDWLCLMVLILIRK